MNKEPLISFIIPFYNREDTLPRCIDSVLKDSTCEYEIILVDDASTDNSGAVCNAYTGRRPNIKYLKSERNRGPGNARNMGIDIASGRYLYFLDSDDEINAEVMPKLAEVMTREEPDFVYIRHLIVLPGGEVRKKGPNMSEGVTSIEEFLEKHPDIPSGSAWMCVCKSQFLRDCGIRFEQTYYVEDSCFLTSVFINAKNFYMLPEFFCIHYSFNTDSLVTTGNIDREIEGFRHYFHLCHTPGEGAKSPALVRSLEMSVIRAVISVMKNCADPIFSEEFYNLTKNDIPPDLQVSYEFYNKHGVKSYLAQWLRSLYERVYTGQSVKRVYLCPISTFSIAVGTVFADWSGGAVSFLDNNPSDTNYYVKLCRDSGFGVSGVKEFSRGDGIILIYHRSYAVERELSDQLAAMSLKEGKDYLSVYSL